MIDESFYTIRNRQECAPLHIVHAVAFNHEHEIFKAHFPDNPIVPGVCCVEIVRQMVGDMLGADMRISVVKNLKFISLMTPAADKVFSFDVDVAENSENQYSVKVTIAHDGTVMTKMSLMCHKS